jgi:hypothetical protein
MKKLLSLLLVAVLLITACTTTENSEDPVVTSESTQPQVTEMSVATTDAPTPTPNIPPQIELHCDDTMPEPFGHHGGGDGHGDFIHLGNYKFMNMPKCISDHYDEYLGEKELIRIWGVLEMWVEGHVSSIIPYITGIMDFDNIYSLAVMNDIPIEIVIAAIDKSNEITAEMMMRLHGIVVNKDEYFYTEEDKAVLLTQDEATILAHFANSYAVVIRDKVYTPEWIYTQTIEGYRAAGITPAMIQEKLPLWQEFGFTDEARAAFEGKLTEFVGVEVSLARE